MASSKKTIAKIDTIFENYTRNASGRIFLADQKKYAELPDLLEIQKRGFEDFIAHYIHRLFEDINPIEDIAGEKYAVEIDDVKV